MKGHGTKRWWEGIKEEGGNRDEGRTLIMLLC